MTTSQPPAAHPGARGDVLALARALIRAPSPNPPGGEHAVAGVVTEIARDLGLPEPEVLARDGNRPNLLFSVDFGRGGRHLVLSGHLDTKPVGDATWQVDPLAADVRGDRLYGLGSADMKAAIAAMLVAAAQVGSEGLGAGRLSLLFTADEEDGASYGAHFLAALQAVRGDAVVIGEPGGMRSDFDRLHLVSRGIARLRITASGRQGHSSLSDLDGSDPAAANAGVAAARAVNAVAAGVPLAVPTNEHDLLGWHATVNTGLAFRGGVGFGVLPGQVSVDTEVRLLPGMDRGQILAALQHAVAGVVPGAGPTVSVGYDTPPRDWLPATQVRPDDAVAIAARDACAAVLGAVPPDSVFPGTTDAAWFGGLAAIPTLPAFGPGLLARAHGADEWVSVSAVRTAVDLYSELARRFCAGTMDGQRR